ncbi:hypothetical protein LSH36_164g09010 [Paralvinella palmiformis]|uniref:BHLH domain-containing protein n=1 Tax=Paralvinella palmiformis TaxID=53620 RepID=A0AAD9JUS0_9ANNE|nr:hypothetical protein LSH36_164g09010 [Paralvinella palmiformis]
MQQMKLLQFGAMTGSNATDDCQDQTSTFYMPVDGLRTYTLLQPNPGSKRTADFLGEGRPSAKMSRPCEKDHCQKVATPSVTKRNERERNRVKQVNLGFERLRQHVPSSESNKKMSKVDTLRAAVDYISQLQTMLEASVPAGMPFEEDSWSLLESTKTLLNIQGRRSVERWRKSNEFKDDVMLYENKRDFVCLLTPFKPTSLDR